MTKGKLHKLTDWRRPCSRAYPPPCASSSWQKSSEPGIIIILECHVLFCKWTEEVTGRPKHHKREVGREPGT